MRAGGIWLFGEPETEKKSDLIKREDAIKWFEPYADRGLKIPVETVIQNLKDIPSAEEWKDECDRAYSTGWIRGMESVDCNICEQRGICERGRAVDCPICADGEKES